MAGLILLGGFAAAEITFFIVTGTKKREKAEWLRGRVVLRAGELAAFLLMLLLPGVSLNFRFQACFAVLLIRAAAALVGWLVKRKTASGVKSRSGAAVGAFGSIFILAAALVPAFLFTGYEGLETTGEYEVKQCQAILVDESRVETFETDGSKREVPVHFYYPDTENEDGKAFPLVIFSHGAFGYYQSNTSTYMELASNGYVVISLDHPYHSFFTKDTAGRLITVEPSFLQEVMRVNREDAVTEEEIFELSRKWLAIRTADIELVLDRVEEAKEAGAVRERSGTEEAVLAGWFIQSEEEESEIRRVLEMTDTAHIGLMGHSMGGAASVTVGRQRPEIGAVVDLDGTMLGEQLEYGNDGYRYHEEAYPVPLLAIDNEEHYQEGKRLGRLYVNQFVLENAVDGAHTYFRGSGHMNFTDLPLFSPVLASLLGTGTVDDAECIQTMNEIILQYFNEYLKGEGEAAIKESYG